MIKVVGVGPGDESLMTFAGKAAIDEAEVLIGARRHLEKWNKNGVEAVAIDKSLGRIVEYIRQNAGKKVVVLASGEPALYGIASYLRKNFEVEVISGISSVQYLFSKIEMNMNDLYITSTHGKQVSLEFLDGFKKVAMVTDNIINPQKIAHELIKIKSKKKMIVGENLSYTGEKIYEFDDLRQAESHEDFGMNVVIIYE
jgi:cobalt-precorrin-7 (C5)-methyltransferase